MIIVQHWLLEQKKIEFVKSLIIMQTKFAGADNRSSHPKNPTIFREPGEPCRFNSLFSFNIKTILQLKYNNANKVCWCG